MRFQKDGPKRRRFTRRELPYGQKRRWGSTVGNFKAEREARRAGLTGKVTKHEPDLINVLLYGRPMVSAVNPLPPGDYTVVHDCGQWWVLTDPSRVRASGEREGTVTSSRSSEDD